MSSEHERPDLTNGPASAFNAGIEALLVLYAPDVVCYPAEGWVQEDVCHGHEGLRRLSSVWLENVEDAALEVHEVRDLNERLLVLAEFTGKAKGTDEPLRRPFGLINSDLRPDGKVGEVRFFMSWEQARQAAGLAG